jgi:UDP-N-acetylmuramyl tripeptide synthase
MNIRNLLHRVRNQFNSQPELSDEVVLKFLNILEQVREEEMTCGDIYTKLDEFVENEVKGVGMDAEKLTPLIREHLDMCSECCDEYEALLSVVEHTREDEEEDKK